MKPKHSKAQTREKFTRYARAYPVSVTGLFILQLVRVATASTWGRVRPSLSFGIRTISRKSRGGLVDWATTMEEVVTAPTRISQ